MPERGANPLVPFEAILLDITGVRVQCACMMPA